MKNFTPFAFLFVLLFISKTSFTQISLEGLVGYYMLDGIAADSSGMGHDGVIMGDVTPTEDRFGVENGALSFNGGHINAYNQSAFQVSDSVTIAAWINPSTLNDWAAIITKWDDFGAGGYYLGINPDGNLVRWNLDMPNPLDGDPILANTWTHIASTYDGDSVKIYQDGQFIIGAPYSNTIANNNADLLIGAQFNLPNAFQFFGSMDDVLIYNRALSQEEILILFDPTTPVHDLLENKIEISIYPNPTSDYLFVKNKSNSQTYSFSIFDSTGRFIRSSKTSNNPIDLSDLAKGIYYLNISVDEKMISKKITVF